MLSVKLPITCQDPEFYQVLALMRKQQTSLSIAGYNWLMKTRGRYNITETERYLDSLKGTQSLDSWFRVSAHCKAKNMFGSLVSGKAKTLVLGGKKNWKDFHAGKISRDSFDKKRLLPLLVVGEKSAKGNRKFRLNLDKNLVVFQPKRGQKKFDLQLPRLKANLQKHLRFIESRAKTCQQPVMVQLTDTYVSFTFEQEKATQAQLNKRRVLAIDTNPNSLGWSVVEYGYGEKATVLKTGLFDFSDLIKFIPNISSTHPKFKTVTAKRRHEILQICNTLIRISNHYKCFRFVVEDLSDLPKGNFRSGCRFNRLVQGSWNRALMFRNLKKHCGTHSIEFTEVAPAYSSVIGNILHNFPDPIAASVELARRGFRKYAKGEFYPKVPGSDVLADRWNEMRGLSLTSWPEVSKALKTTGLKYRRPLEDFSFSVSRFHSTERSKVKLLTLQGLEGAT